MSNQIVELDDCQFIKISGPDNRKFLQGQLSCNMERLSPELSLRAAICNLKGRVVSDLRVLQLDDACLLQVGSGMANAVVTTLSKYAVFSKVRLEIQDQHPAPFGVLGVSAEILQNLFPTLPDTSDAVCQIGDASLIRVAGELPRFELWFHNQLAAKRFRAAIPVAALAPMAAWRRAEIESGVVHVDPSMTEEYTPQLLNYDISGVIDFKKGCYTGQEVVARMFYRGTAKKRLYLGSTQAKICADDSVHQTDDGEDKNAEIMAFSNTAKGDERPNVLLTILSTDAVESGKSFTLANQPAATLTVVPLSY